jgi:DNA-binding beta-propeller fold protein YncE
VNRREFLGACAVVAIATACKSTESSSGDVHVSATDLIATDAAGVRYRARPGEDLVARLDSRGGEVWTRAVSGTGPGQFDYPTSLAADDRGRLLVVDRGNSRVQILDAATGDPLGEFGQSGTGTGEFHIARDIAVTSDRIYVVDQCNHRINAYDVAGRPFGTVGAFGMDAAGLNAPLSVAVDGEGTIYAVDSSADAVKRYHPDGRFAGVVEHPDVDHPQSVAVDGDGRRWIADGVAGRVAVLTPDGALVRSIPITLPDGRPGAPRDIAIAGRDLFVRALPNGPAA